LGRQRDNAEALFLLAKVRSQRNDPEGAIECLRKIGPSSTVKPQAFYEVSEIFWKQRRATLAEHCWQEAVREATTENGRRSQWAFWSLARLGDLYLLESRDDEARAVLWQLFDSVDRRDGAAVDFLVQLTRFDLEIESPTIGIDKLQPFLDADPTDVQARRAIAAYFLRMGDTEKAGALLRALIEEAPLAWGVYENWVQFLLSTGDHAAARRALAQIPDRLVPTATLWKLRGRDHESHGEFPQAVECYRKAVALAPRSQDTSARLAQALRAAGHKDRFEQLNRRVARQSFLLTELSAYLGKFPRRPGNTMDVAACRHLAQACTQLEWIREAKAWHELVIARQPDATESRQAIGDLEKKLQATNALDPTP
jgi:tetratricopeptide (TPR) repeat protein